jgi:hypothetical protein
MERPKRPYSLHSRPTKRKNRKIFYALFRDGNGTYRSSAVSTGCTRHDDAVRWAIDRAGVPVPEQRGRHASPHVMQMSFGASQSLPT